MNDNKFQKAKKKRRNNYQIVTIKNQNQET